LDTCWTGQVPGSASAGYGAGVAASAAKRANARQTVQGVPVNTRTIAIVALVIAVIVLIVLLT
jgi:hypothetical protein